MADFVKKEKHSGVYEPTGEKVKFNVDWGGHHFSDDECEKLLAGDSIEFDATSKAGKDYTAKGKLEQQEYEGHTFWGFKAHFDD